MLCSKHAIALLRASEGSIVNIASTRALQSEPDCEAYAASKAGLLGLTHAMAASLGPEIRVNAVSPGWIDTRAWRASGDREPDPLTAGDHAQHPTGRVEPPGGRCRGGALPCRQRLRHRLESDSGRGHDAEDDLRVSESGRGPAWLLGARKRHPAMRGVFAKMLQRKLLQK